MKLKKASTIAGLLVLGLIALAYAAYLSNSTPFVAPVASDSPAQPYAVKLHAQWCPVCMVTKGVWKKIEADYSGRVRLVVFDFTDEVTTEKSRVEAKRLGLEKYFDEHAGWTGTISVLDSQGDVVDSLHGNRDFASYRELIDKALANNR